MGPQLTVLIIEVSLFHRFIYTHLYCNGTTTDCPYYRGVLISQVFIHIYIAMGPQLTVLIIEVSLFHRFIYTHLYCNGTTTDCPYYRGVLISQVHLYTFILQWDHN